MRIEFDPTNRDEATAVRAVLAALHPDTQDNNWEQRFADITGSDDPEELERVESEVKELLSVDANNEPHDPRIHSTSAKTNADGTWRAKRGVTAEQVAAVRAEREALEATGGVVESTETTLVGEVPSEQTVPADTPPQTEASGNENVTVQVSAPAPTPPAPPSAPPAPAPVGEQPAPQAPDAPVGDQAVSFLDVMKAITAAQKDGHVTTAKVKELCAAIGAGDSTMGLNGADKGELRVQFMALLDGEVGQ